MYIKKSRLQWIDYEAKRLRISRTQLITGWIDPHIKKICQNQLADAQRLRQLKERERKQYEVEMNIVV